MSDDAKDAQTSSLILYEQLRMPLQAMNWAIYPGLVLLTLIVWAFRSPCDRNMIEGWCAVAALTWLGGALHAKSRLKLKFNLAAAKRLMTELRLLYAFEGAVWGFLPWATLSSCGPMEIALSIAINGGVAASRMMLLSSVSSVFLVYILVGGGVWIVNTWSYAALQSSTLGVIGILYVTTLIFQARVHARSLFQSISLRFENQDLLQALNQQVAITEAAREKAEDANRAKSQFLAAASHDLRQPAMAQGLFLEILSGTSLDSDQHKLLENLHSANTALAQMLDTLLDYSRIEAGVIQPEQQDVRLQPLLNKIEREFGAQADARNLIYRSRETDLIVHTDPALLELILRNLVSNAIRYTEHGGVLVGCRRRDRQAVLEVWDTGIGIAPEYQQEIFDEFMQLGNPERDRRKGLGLGLSIVNGLARSLVHRISLSSRPGRGSVFRLALPIVASAPATIATAPESPLRLRGVRVLVIDDEDAVRTGLQHLLTVWGCSCDAVETIAAAIASVRQHPPAVIISDYRLRGEDTGIDAIAALRAELCNDLPALLITGDIALKQLPQSPNGRIPMLRKPVSPEVLRSALSVLLAPVQAGVPTE